MQEVCLTLMLINGRDRKAISTLFNMAAPTCTSIIYDHILKLNEFVATKCVFKEEVCVLITHKQLYNHPSTFWYNITVSNFYTRAGVYCSYLDEESGEWMLEYRYCFQHHSKYLQ